MVVKTPAMISTSHIEMWIPGAPSGAVERNWKLTCSKWPRGEPAGRVRPGGVERDVAEVEQPGVADDDVEADRHHREHDHHDHRVGPRDEVADQRKILERLDDLGVDQREDDERRRRSPTCDPVPPDRTSSPRSDASRRACVLVMRLPASAPRAAPRAGRRGSGSGSRTPSCASSRSRGRTT